MADLASWIDGLTKSATGGAPVDQRLDDRSMARNQDHATKLFADSVERRQGW